MWSTENVSPAPLSSGDAEFPEPVIAQLRVGYKAGSVYKIVTVENICCMSHARAHAHAHEYPPYMECLKGPSRHHAHQAHRITSKSDLVPQRF